MFGNDASPIVDDGFGSGTGTADAVIVDSGVGEAVLYAVATGILVELLIGVFVAGGIAVSAGVGVLVGVAVTVFVGMGVRVGVGVSAVVTVAVAISVLVSVGVSVGVAIAVLVGVSVSVAVGVAVAVAVEVAVFVGVAVAMGVQVGSGVGAGALAAPTARGSQAVSMRRSGANAVAMASHGTSLKFWFAPSLRVSCATNTPRGN